MKTAIVALVFVLGTALCDNGNGTSPDANKKTVPLVLLQLRPIKDVITKFWAQLHHPNGYLANYLKPTYIWEKLLEKKQELLSNPSAAIYGFGQSGGHDYPFPYRGLDQFHQDGVTTQNS